MIDTNLHSSLNVGKKPCTTTECERPILAKGLCGAHYQRQHGWTRPSDMPHKRFCSVSDCDKPHVARGYCTLHYARWKEHGDVTVTHRYDSQPRDPVYCTFDGCQKRHVALGYCRKHYTRFVTHGNPAISTRMLGIGDTPTERFWSRVALTANPDKCWEWQGIPGQGGYGYIRWGGRVRGTHTIAYEIHTGVRPTLNILHSCDNPPCCNPRHLRQGTSADNHADMKARGRHLVGSKNPHSRMIEADVIWAREMHEQGWSKTKIADELDMSRVAVSRAISRKSWKHV